MWSRADAAPSDTSRVAVELSGVGKHFGGVRALSDVSVTVAAGSVHAFVGENGAGKSTLGKIVSGVHTPDSGRVIVRGREVRYCDPREAALDGVIGVAQEIRLLPQLSVLDNVFVGIERHRLGMLDRKGMSVQFSQLCEWSGIELPMNRLVGGLSIGQQQQVELLRALARSPRVLVLDEPTAALARREIAVLEDVVCRLRADGVTVIYVSHSLDEVLALSDAVTVLRDGRVTKTNAARQETAASLVEAMVGHELGLAFPPKPPVPEEAPVVLAVEGLCGGKVRDVDLSIRAGEIVGVAGLMGSGRTSLVRLIFGADRATAGTVSIEGKVVRLRAPVDAIERGVALVPESRKEQGLVMQRSVRENVALIHGRRASRGGVIDQRRERETVGTLVSQLALRGGVEDPVAALSGGNQQKVVVAKSLWETPRVLIADEPGRGIDIAAKREMFRLIADLAAQGAAVLMVSSEIEELIGLAARVIVMRDGRLVADLAGAAMSEHAIVSASFPDAGGSTNARGDTHEQRR